MRFALMADTSIPDNALTPIVDSIDAGNLRVAELFPGDSPARQPVHVVYGGAHLFRADTAAKLGAVALRVLQEHAPDAATFAAALGYRVHLRVVEKLAQEPVEDLRIDFEDGFGVRSDGEEDAFATLAADEAAAGLARGTLPPSIGIRIKPLNPEHKRRSLRTFDLFLTRLVDRTGGQLPPNFVVTLPKVTSPEQVAAMASACEAFEYWRSLAADSLRFELMIETPQSIVAADGTVALPRFVAEGRGRLVAVHFGPYDYTAACGITAAHQVAQHPAYDFARRVMQTALAGTGIWLSDGPLNVLPIGSREAVHGAWRLHAEQIRHALVNGFYQGWDLHPAQLPSRYAAVYAFFLEGLAAASARLKNFVDKAGQATRVGDVFDDAATGQGLLDCGAITEREAVDMSGLSLDELRSKSFATIVSGRR
jgi:citrate lyase beta subunit